MKSKMKRKRKKKRKKKSKMKMKMKMRKKTFYQSIWKTVFFKRCLKNTVIVKIFKSFIDKFDRATNEENKEKAVKELTDINSFV